MNALFGENSQNFYRDMTREQKMQMHLKLEQMQCLPISAPEFFQNIFPDHVTCSNPKCFKFHQIDNVLRSNSSTVGTLASNLNDTTKFSIEGYNMMQSSGAFDENEILIAADF
jgi:hypothetical protein